jgi:hypothetical protein
MKFGPFHRLFSPTTQNIATAKKQARSKEIWGRTPRRGMEPTVQAYYGHLPDGREGIEFYTEAEPAKGTGKEARWYKSQNMQGAVLDASEDAVKIVVDIVLQRYKCKTTIKAVELA